MTDLPMLVFRQMSPNGNMNMGIIYLVVARLAIVVEGSMSVTHSKDFFHSQKYIQTLFSLVFATFISMHNKSDN